jgi:hypothetical protein
MAKYVNCKRCNTPNLFWLQTVQGKWYLQDENGIHRCNNEQLKPVKCKYCNANDLHWSEEINPYTGLTKATLTESYGLPHACDERLSFVAKQKQEKKDKYEAEKQRISTAPNGKCLVCDGKGIFEYRTCSACLGHGIFNDRNRKYMLSKIRQTIWPHITQQKY